jgi:hypothetical protein
LTLTTTGPVLAVECEHASYVIEPIRYRLGRTRIQMVDDHLAALTSTGRARSPDVDALLDARTAFAT